MSIKIALKSRRGVSTGTQERTKTQIREEKVDLNFTGVRVLEVEGATVLERAEVPFLIERMKGRE